MFYVLENFCCCEELRIGSLMVGYVGLASSFILIPSSIAAMATSGYIADNAENEKSRILDTVIFAFMCIALIAVLLYFIFNIILLVGLHKHKRGHVQAYLIFLIIYFSFDIFVLIGNIQTGRPIKEISSSLLSMVLTVYFLLVVRNYYLKMNDHPNRPFWTPADEVNADAYQLYTTAAA